MEKKQKKSWMDDYKDVKDFFASVQFNGLPRTGELKDFTDRTDVKVSIWRANKQDGKLYPTFVLPNELKKDDVVFVDGYDYEGYAAINELTTDTDGKINNLNIVPMNFPLYKENHMLHIVENIIVAAQAHTKEKINIIVAIKQA